MEWIDGWSVREILGGGQDDVAEDAEEEVIADESLGSPEDVLREAGIDEGAFFTVKRMREEPDADLCRRSDSMLRAIGREIGKMHLADIIHGDLTTSNMMVRLTNAPQRFELVRDSRSPRFPCTDLQIFPEQVLIDFGLSSTSPMHEDRAVDLYVLERAFSSTHPVQPGGIAHFEVVLEGYREALQRGKKGEWERVEKRLEEVRMRGRKRSMVG